MMREAITPSRACPICESRAASLLHHQRLAQAEGSPLPAEYDLVACANCDMVYADTAAEQAAYDKYYASQSKYEDPAVATGGGGSELDRARIAELADRIAARLPREARIIDVGCAGGGLLAALRDRGYQFLHGLDAATGCVRQVQDLGIGATCASLSDLASACPRRAYDLVILSHVLEHVVDLRPLMASVATLLDKSGLAYVETPDARRYVTTPFVPYYFFDSEHINHFDVGHLGSLAATCGLGLVDGGITDLCVGSGMQYPACWAWLSAEAPRNAAERDVSLSVAVAQYIAWCRRDDRFSSLAGLAKSGRPVIVWGAGSFAQRLFASSPLHDCSIVAIADRDRNKQGLVFGGYRVQSPEAALASRPDAVVVIAAALHGAAIASEIARHWPGVEMIVLAAAGQPDEALRC